MEQMVENFLVAALDWVRHNVLTVNFAAQWASLAGCAIFAWLLSSLFAKKTGAWIDRNIKSELVRTVLTLPEGVGFSLVFLVLTQVLIAGFIYFDDFPRWLFIATDIALAWIVIKYLTRIIPNRALARIISLVVWLAALLRILGVLDYVIEYLQGMQLDMGDTSLSVYGALTGLLMAALCLQLASMVGKFINRRIEKVEDLSPSLKVLLSKLVNIGLFTFAILFAMTSMGINLTSLAIFSSALGVGVGFGLRTIVANYVAGVLLLLDNSIKPGDNIEMSGVFGVVRDMRARYASVLTRDGKEHLVPNELLISNEVINLTYSSRNVRLNIPVGISYGSDVNLARVLLERSTEGVERVLPYPKPMARLVGFGDNSVDFQLRLWIADAEKGIINVKSEILFNIWDLFHEYDVEFPFPQRDVGIKPESRITVKLEKDDAVDATMADAENVDVPQPEDGKPDGGTD